MEQPTSAERVSPAKPPKNVVICCDGTGNKYGFENSNVVKIYTCLKENAGQACYYHPGVGTMGDPRHTSRFAKAVSMVGGLAFGMGFTDCIADAYRFLMEHYADGDRIFLFGFSRGAYAVRALAGALRVYGLLCRGNEGHLPYLLDMYSTKSRDAYNKRNQTQIKPDALSDGFRETFSHTVPIYFMGIWDTVSSIGGLYDPVKLLYDGQNSILRKARHAVSVDERRCFFQANLLGEPLSPPATPVLVESYTDPADHHQDIVQAWFAGVHSDVGGSYLQGESSPAMDVLTWILDEAESDGLQVNEAKRDAIFGRPSPTYPGLEKLNVAAPSLTRLHRSLTLGWAWLEVFPHKYFDATGRKRWHFIPWPHSREIPDGALIHPTLRALLHPGADYQPKNLNPDYIRNFNDSPVRLHRKAVKWLQGYGVYRPDTPAKAPAVRPIAAAIATAALLLLGLAGWWVRTLR